ncbi:MAG: hypothetical protein LZF60_380198 [Nitrospira sp.]|nr:MAG: hypothetical protein LZF60_380198 [Nitrospira sp.]
MRTGGRSSTPIPQKARLQYGAGRDVRIQFCILGKGWHPAVRGGEGEGYPPGRDGICHTKPGRYD